MWLRMIAGGGGGGLTFEQPELNIVRGAYYALISALSGAQTMALCCYDEAYTIPTEYAQRISLRTMQLLIEEMGLSDTVDPLGGSYYVETLTNQMRAEMERIMAEVDARGGIVKLVADGSIQAQVSAQAYAHAARHRRRPLPQGRRQLLPHRRGGAAGRVPPLQRGGRHGADRAARPRCARERDAGRRRSGARRACAEAAVDGAT